MLEALIPYIQAPEKTLIDHVPLIGPVKLQVFGPLVATGVILGWFRGVKYAQAKGMDEWFVRDYMWWQILIAFAFGHWVSVLFYFPDQVAENPWVLLAFWNGLSSVGGFIGGTLAIFWFLKKYKEPLLVYGDLSV
jgi:phosphatidylglycerol:prolipoprotein diacylglycerol transferase